MLSMADRKFNINWDWRDFWVGVFWTRGSCPVSVMKDPEGNHGRPSYAYPIHEVLFICVNPIPCLNLEFKLMWKQKDPR